MASKAAQGNPIQATFYSEQDKLLNSQTFAYPPYEDYSFAATTYDSFASIPTSTSSISMAPMSAYDTLGAFKYGTYPQALSESPSLIPPALTDLPSTMSSSSSASVPSAASSAIGSPNSSVAQAFTGQENWMDMSHGLGFVSGVLPSENFGNETFMSSGLDHENMYATTKIPGFVGKSEGISSAFKSNLVPFQSSNSVSITSSVTHNETLRGSHITMESPMNETDSQATTPRAEQYSSLATPPGNTSPILYNKGARQRSLGGIRPFKSPITPASALPSSSPVNSPETSFRRRSRTQSISSPSLSHFRGYPSTSLATTDIGHVHSPVQASTTHLHTPFFAQSSGNFVAPLESSYPNLIQSYPPPPTMDPGYQYGHEYSTFSSGPNAALNPASPTPSHSSVQSYHAPQSNLNNAVQPSFHSTFQQQFVQPLGRSPSISSSRSHHSPRSGSDFGDEGREKGRCPIPECGRVFRDLKAHMLTHQTERPEKCPITTCEYNQKGFARKYDKNRHTLTHYKGTMVCGFCPGSGSSAEKSFNRADVFKRHLTSVHGVEQTPPNSRRKSPNSAAGSTRKISSYCQDATGKCSTCSGTFSNAQDFYEHLDDCVLRVVQQEEPSEAINAQKMAEMANDKEVKETLERNMLTNTMDSTSFEGQEDEDEDDDDEEEESSDHGNDRSGRGSLRTSSKNHGNVLGPNKSGIVKRTTGPRKGLTHSKGGVPSVGKGRKKRKNYPPSWGVNPEKMKMKKRVVCVYDGQRRLWKDEMMLHNDFEVRMPLADGTSYVTDLDVKTLQRTEALHNATEEEKGPWNPESQQDLDIEQLMRV
ncbi:MAG: hypothetical protein M1834_004596 [Cirrosporium novae-zelandiae]|nr:MAG: hypothetical protein M1834_004596 [Cirrosporium novae-zelandiae]